MDNLTQDTTQKEIQGLRNELYNKTTAIENALENIKKAELILNHWADEYMFAEKPDPRLAIEYGRSCPVSNDILKTQSATWFYDYNLIIQFINIATDYVYATKKELSEILNEISQCKKQFLKTA